MTIFLIVLSVILLLAGIAGLFIPYLTDAPLVFAGIFLFSFATGLEYIHPATLGILAFITLFVVIVDLFASQIGVKKVGGSYLSVVLSFVLGFIGLLAWNILGLIGGVFLGALLGELIVTKDLKKSAKVSLGSLLGFLSGLLFKGMMLVLMIGIFIGSFLV